MNYNSLDRRNFLKMSLLGGTALAMPWSANRTLAAAEPAAAAPRSRAAGAPAKMPSRVAVTAGEDRADWPFRRSSLSPRKSPRRLATSG